MDLKNILSSIFLLGVSTISTANNDISEKEMINDYKVTSVPSNLNWPIKYSSIKNISLFFDSEDAIESIGRHCPNNSFPYHLGIDIAASNGTEVYPIKDGKFKRSGYETGWGYYVVLSHDNDTWTSVYWHLQSKLNKKFDEKINLDSVIGKVFDTSGKGDISHVHLGISDQPYYRKYIPEVPYAIGSHSGIGLCKNQNNYLFSFVNPLDYLSHRGYTIIDDINAYHSGNWKSSNATDFYHGSGYKALQNTNDGFVKYTNNIVSKGYYSIYAKFPVEPNRTLSAKYQIYVNGVLKKTKFINQADIDNRGKNVFLYLLPLNRNDTIEIKVSNGDNSGWLISDAIVFRRL